MITVKNLQKMYKIAKPGEGRFATLKALVRPQYEERRAVDGIDFTISDGEIVGYNRPERRGEIHHYQDAVRHLGAHCRGCKGQWPYPAQRPQGASAQYRRGVRTKDLPVVGRACH